MSKKPSGFSGPGARKEYKKDASPKYKGPADKPFKRAADKDDSKPFRKDAKGKPAPKDGAYSKDFSGKPFKRATDKDGDKKPYGDRPFKKPFDKDARKPFDRDDKKPYKERGERKEYSDKPFKKPFDRDDKKPYKERGERKEYGDKPFKKPFDKERKPFDRDDKKPYKERGERKEYGDKPFKKPFDKERKPFDRDDKKPYKERGGRKEYGDKPFKKPFDKERKPFDKDAKPSRKGSKFDKDDKKAPPFEVMGERIYDEDEKVKKPFKKKDKEEEKGPFKSAFAKTKDKNKPEPVISEMEGFTKSLDDDKPIRGFIYTKDKNAKAAPKPVKDETKKPSRRKKVEDWDDEDEDDMADDASASPSDKMPLNKYIAHSGECSRRDAAELVKKGKVKVNGELIMDPGYKVAIGDLVTIAGKKLTPQKSFVYVLLNKPKDYITTTEDPGGRKTVMDLVQGAGVDRLYPVGRLDRNTTGLLLLTNDGDLAQKLSHPSYNTKKIYQVTLDKALTKAHFEKILAGLELEDGITTVDSLAYLEKKNELGIEIHSGKNRIVRRIFESLGYTVDKLDRVVYAGLTKKLIGRGQWRFLTEREIVLLKHFKS